MDDAPVQWPSKICRWVERTGAGTIHPTRGRIIQGRRASATRKEHNGPHGKQARFRQPNRRPFELPTPPRRTSPKR
jgi:hypothetical protein